MKWSLAAFALVSAGLAAVPAHADTSINQLYILDVPGNHGSVTAEGDGKAVSVVQSHDGLGAANTLEIGLFGDLNGGPLAAEFDAPAPLGLRPGQVSQSGSANAINLTVQGNANLFAFSQNGVGNALTGLIMGNNNQAAVAQIGSGNSFSFVQNGNGNVLSVIQRSGY